MPNVSLALPTPGSRVAVVRPLGYFGRTLFERYKNVCDAGGARFNKERGCNVAPLLVIANVARRLEAEGFSLLVSNELADAVQAELERIDSRTAAANATVNATIEKVVARGLKPLGFQVPGAQWLAARRGGVLADQMGLGKTVQALLAIPPKAPVIIVCPASLKVHWLVMGRRWRPDLIYYKLEGRDSFHWPKPGRVHILNYEILPEEVDAPPEGCVVIVDECHLAKNPEAIRTKRLRGVIAASQKANGSAWPMSGTPLLNRPPELWSVLRLVPGLAEYAFGSWMNFVRLFNGRKGYGGSYQWGLPSPEVPAMLSRVMLRRLRDQVLQDLPGKTYADPDVVEIDDETKRLCDEVMAVLRERGITLDNAADLAKPLTFATFSKVRAALARAKTRRAIDIIEEYEEEEEPLVVFSAHADPVIALGKRPGWAAIHGGVPMADRQPIVDALQEGRLRGIAGTIDTAGVGFTMTKACHALFIDLEWSPELNKQASDRLDRIGQTRGVVIRRILANHELDFRVDELLAIKAEIIEAAIERVASFNATGVQHYDTAADVEYLRRLASTPPSDKPRTPTAAPTVPAESEAKPRTKASTEQQRWMIAKLNDLAAADADRARVVNGVGFSKFDGDFGRKLITDHSRFGLTERQWGACARLCHKYRRQIGEFS